MKLRNRLVIDIPSNLLQIPSALNTPMTPNPNALSQFSHHVYLVGMVGAFLQADGDDLALVSMSSTCIGWKSALASEIQKAKEKHGNVYDFRAGQMNEARRALIRTFHITREHNADKPPSSIFADVQGYGDCITQNVEHLIIHDLDGRRFMYDTKSDESTPAIVFPKLKRLTIYVRLDGLIEDLMATEQDDIEDLVMWRDYKGHDGAAFPELKDVHVQYQGPILRNSPFLFEVNLGFFAFAFQVRRYQRIFAYVPNTTFALEPSKCDLPIFIQIGGPGRAFVLSVQGSGNSWDGEKADGMTGDKMDKQKRKFGILESIMMKKQDRGKKRNTGFIFNTAVMFARGLELAPESHQVDTITITLSTSCHHATCYGRSLSVDTFTPSPNQMKAALRDFYEKSADKPHMYANKVHVTYVVRVTECAISEAEGTDVLYRWVGESDRVGNTNTTLEHYINEGSFARHTIHKKCGRVAPVVEESDDKDKDKAIREGVEWDDEELAAETVEEAPYRIMEVQMDEQAQPPQYMEWDDM